MDISTSPTKSTAMQREGATDQASPAKIWRGGAPTATTAEPTNAALMAMLQQPMVCTNPNEQETKQYLHYVTTRIDISARAGHPPWSLGTVDGTQRLVPGHWSETGLQCVTHVFQMDHGGSPHRTQGGVAAQRLRTADQQRALDVPMLGGDARLVARMAAELSVQTLEDAARRIARLELQLPKCQSTRVKRWEMQETPVGSCTNVLGAYAQPGGGCHLVFKVGRVAWAALHAKKTL